MEKSKKRRSVSHTDWDAIDTDLKATDYTQDGDTLVVKDKGSAEKGGRTKGTDLQQSTVKPDEGTDKQYRGTDITKVSTDSFVEGTAEIKDQVSGESDTLTAPTITSTPTLTVFGMMRLLHKFLSQ
ncbi:hypothetical protein Tco_1281506 [Tanacetum coccineum]